MKNSIDKKEGKKVIKDSKYYYDLDLSKYGKLPADELLYKKILAAKKLLRKLVLDDDMEDYHRINDISNAIAFNKKLLLELGFDMAEISKKINELQKEDENV